MHKLAHAVSVNRVNNVSKLPVTLVTKYVIISSNWSEETACVVRAVARMMLLGGLETKISQQLRGGAQ